MNPGKPETSLLALLLLTDLAFATMHVLLGFGLLDDMGWAFTRDQSYGEVFQYVKELWCALLLLHLAILCRAPLFGYLSVLFLVILFDDYTEFHEYGGEWIASRYHFVDAMRLKSTDFGELAVMLSYLLALGVPFAFFYWRASAGIQAFARKITFLLGVLFFFVAIFDLVHEMETPRMIHDALGVVEDGGEHVALSLLVWLLFKKHVDPSTLVIREG